LPAKATVIARLGSEPAKAVHARNSRRRRGFFDPRLPILRAWRAGGAAVRLGKAAPLQAGDGPVLDFGLRRR